MSKQIMSTSTHQQAQPIAKRFNGIGYTRKGHSFPLEVISLPVPTPKRDEVLIEVFSSSLNPLEFKLAQLNFQGAEPPLILGFDLAGIVVATGEDVDGFKPGDRVMAMADLNGHGGWGDAITGGYAVARDFLTVLKPAGLSFREAGCLPMCFLSAYMAMKPWLAEGDSVYIPGGGGGVGHLALQMAARTLGAGYVISSGSTPESIALARSSGADYVIDYKSENVTDKILELTHGKGVDLVYDATYSEQSFIHSASAISPAGHWIVLGVGPGKTSRVRETASPVADILTQRGAKMVNFNLLKYFTHPQLLDSVSQTLFRQAMDDMARWAEAGKVLPYIQYSIAAEPIAIGESLQQLAKGSGNLGKIAVEHPQRLSNSIVC